MFQRLYTMERPIKSLGKHYRAPSEFEYGKDILVATIARTSEDGFNVEVYECRLPARFWTLKALPTPDSLGREREGFTMSTGSGDEMGELIGKMALAVSNGMLAP